MDFVQTLFDVFLGGDWGDSQQGEPPQPGEGFEEHHCLMATVCQLPLPLPLFFFGNTNTL